ncbi:MAG: glycoside hydrolase family 95 protein [Thalassotalea sp.]
MNFISISPNARLFSVFSMLFVSQVCVSENQTNDVMQATIKSTSSAQQLYFEQPAIVDISPKTNSPQNKKIAKNRGKAFMGQALPLGNGRFGAMFSGGVESEYIVFNEITLWANSSRGQNEIDQAGAPRGGYKHLETVRKAARDRKFGTGKDSVESLGTKYLVTKQSLGNYAPFADLKISTNHNLQNATNYRRALDISNGLGLVNYEIAGVKYSREFLCSFPDDLCVIRLAAQGGVMNLSLSAATVHDRQTIIAKGNELTLHGYTPMNVGEDMEFLQTAKVDAGNAKVIANGKMLDIKDASEVIIYVAGATDYLPTYPSFKGNDVQAANDKVLKVAMEKGYQSIKRDHVTDVSELMQRVNLNLNVKPSNLPTDQLVKKGSPLELYKLHFDYARYLQISSSRNAAVPSNLQGLWNTFELPPWNSDYHTDINIQMNYWMAETTNLSESFSPYVDWAKIVAKGGQYAAKETFGVNKGWSIGLNSNVFGFTAQNFHGRRMQQGGHWLSQHLFEHYSFNKNIDYLADIYPVQKGACQFFVEHLAPWQDGTLLVYPTWSPENFFLSKEHSQLNKQGWGASYDQQLLVNLFTDCIEAAVVLKRDVEFRQILRDLIPRLTPQKINSHGMVQEWPEDLDDPKNTHRHLSHLFALHPGRDFSPLTTKQFSDAAVKQMKVRLKKGWRGAGWAGAWRSSMWARTRNGDRALKDYHDLIYGMPYINLFNGAPWQIDANLGAAAAVAEMLLQSQLRSIDATAEKIEDAAFVAYKEDPTKANHFIGVAPPDTLADAAYILDLLPALPSLWTEGSVTGLKARGGFVVDMSWKNNKLEKATIKATRNGKFRLYDNGSLSKTFSLKQGESFEWLSE